MWERLSDYVVGLGFLGVLDIILVVVFVAWILMTKRDATAATAWCLVVLFVPLLGAFLFWFFGYNRVYRPIRQKQRHRDRFRAVHPPSNPQATSGPQPDQPPPTWEELGRLAVRVQAFPVSQGNLVEVQNDTAHAFRSILDAVASARHHVHLAFFIFRSDDTGRELADALARKARQGVEVRLLVDGIGTGRLRMKFAGPLQEAGVRLATFLPLDPLRLRIRFNLRNHRKIVVVDGRVGFTGGMNIGDEYLGKDHGFGYWRDTMVRVEGPAAASFQRVFCEDWDFARGEALNGPTYYPPLEPAGPHTVQVAASGPDQEVNTNRELFFAALTGARRRVWIASPYFVPDAGLFDALRLACHRGVEVRLLSLLRPDHYVSFYAGRYYWADLLRMGAQVYQYARGMMHSKVILVDDDLALVGSANFDNRSLRLNFEVACLLYSADLIAAVEKALERDFADAILLDEEAYRARSFTSRLAENACRLFAPNL